MNGISIINEEHANSLYMVVAWETATGKLLNKSILWQTDDLCVEIIFIKNLRR